MNCLPRLCFLTKSKRDIHRQQGKSCAGEQRKECGFALHLSAALRIGIVKTVLFCQNSIIVELTCESRRTHAEYAQILSLGRCGSCVSERPPLHRNPPKPRPIKSIAPFCCASPVDGRHPFPVQEPAPNSSDASRPGPWSHRCRYGGVPWARLTPLIPKR